MTAWLRKWWHVLRGRECERSGERLRQAANAYHEAVVANVKASIGTTMDALKSGSAVKATAHALLDRMRVRDEQQQR